MANLPILYTDNKDLHMMQTKWKSQLDPILALPQNSGLILKKIQLQSGTNVINHLLGRSLKGWSLVRIRGAAQIYDDQDVNQTPDLTLILISNATVSVDVMVF